MELIEPWKVTIGKLNVGNQFDLDEILNELLLMEHVVEENADDHVEILGPNITLLRDTFITPAALDYVEKTMQHVKGFFSSNTWAVSLKDNKSLEVHIHSDSNITTVFYPMDSDTALVLVDPRGAACRGYPSAVRANHFGRLRITPRAGDLYIFPSYLQHYVVQTDNEFRLSLVTDYFFNQ